MADYSAFTSLVSSFMPNVPPFVVTKAAQQCCQNFFSLTTELQEKLTITTVIGQSDYALTPTVADTYVNLVLNVENPDEHAVAYKQIGGTLTVYPKPNAALDLTVLVALTPNINATQLDDDVYFRNTAALRFGLIAILKAQIGTEWYSPNEVPSYQQMYEREITQTKILQLTDVQYPTMQVPPFI